MRDAASGDCVACPKGTYTDAADAGRCNPCPDGQTTLGEGTAEAALCYCKFIFNYLTAKQ